MHVYNNQFLITENQAIVSLDFEELLANKDHQKKDFIAKGLESNLVLPDNV